ncbi:MAG: hypothetical protein RL380_644 [Verrucomicrobiota bacterium]|jgi:hypothetical protein
MTNAHFIRAALPAHGLFAGQTWRISPAPFPLGAELTAELDSLGRLLLQFYRAANLLYRRSVEGKQPAWIAQLLDQGKPARLLELQRHSAFKNEVPRVIRPDILLTDDGFRITELDSVPGGIGLTAWLNQTYSDASIQQPAAKIIGGERGMIDGFVSIFGNAKNVHVIVSEESASYKPEMDWLASQTQSLKLKIQNADFTDFADGDAVYRFFELFDVGNVRSADQIFALATEKKIRLTPPPKPLFEEKLLFALFWNHNLHAYWRQELGESFLKRLQRVVPYTWVVDPAPLPPHAALPRLELTDWTQLKTLSQRDRELILKISGYSERAWGARGVSLGSDLSLGEWSAAVDEALRSFPTSPFVLQRFEKPRLVEAAWFDFAKHEAVPMPGRARLCPYYFVSGDGDNLRPQLGGVLATICPADKKIIHGMTDAILAPCCV